MKTLPVIDISPLVAGTGNREAVATAIGEACRSHGFFYVSGHGIAPALVQCLEALSHQFFKRDEATKMQWRMALGGRAWRGYFPLGGELTSGRPDWKEGLYLGTESPDDHAAVQTRTPVHGRNLFPDVPGFKSAILDYMAAVTQLGHQLMEGIALSLQLDARYFHDRYTEDPLILFRLFNYPAQPVPEGLDVQWGVGEHTDYGLLTILHQDDVGGLYKSTPHRVVRNTSGRDRLSFPLFFDPNFEARVQRIEGLAGSDALDDSAERWDRANVHAFNGRYGDYLLAKVSKVFPQLTREVL
jgi:isopenicillin N synthase-like dioxygenase